MLEKFEQLGNGASFQTLVFSYPYLYLKSFPLCGPPNLDLDTDQNDQKMEKSFTNQVEGNSTLNFQANLIEFIMVAIRRGLLCWRLGQAQESCHQFSTGAKWLSPMLTPALVVPCWLDQLTNQGGLIFVGTM